MTRKTLSSELPVPLASPSIEAPMGLRLDHSSSDDENEDDDLWEPIPVSFALFRIDENGLGSGIVKWEPMGGKATYVTLKEGGSTIFGRDGYLGGQLVTVDAQVMLEDGVVWIRFGCVSQLP